MIRTTLGKFKGLRAVGTLPRVYKADGRLSLRHEILLSHGGQLRASKGSCPTTDADAGNEQEKCQQIIDRTFEPNSPLQIASMVTDPPTEESHTEKCQRIINQIFGEDGKLVEVKRENAEPIKIPVAEILQATTSRHTEEKLAQKIEDIEEDPLVEPHRAQLEGFHGPPKVLGGRGNEGIGNNSKLDERVPIINCYSQRNDCNKDNSGTSSTFDELAKRCLDAPAGQIDERLLEEMEKMGVPSAGSELRKRVDHGGLIQTDVVRKPRRPAAKPDLDILSLNKVTIDRLQSNTPPPFRLATGEFVPPIHRRDNVLTTERLPSLFSKNLDLNFDDGKGSNATCQGNMSLSKILSHMAATAVSGEDATKDKGNETEKIMDRQENLGDNVTIKIVEETRTPLEVNANSKPVNTINNHITYSTKTTEQIEVEKLNALTIKNLLQTRIEHLTRSRIRSAYFVDEAPLSKSQNSIGNKGEGTLNEPEKTQKGIAILQHAGSHRDDDPMILKDTPHGKKTDTSSIPVETVVASMENIEQITNKAVVCMEPNQSLKETIYKPERVVISRRQQLDTILEPDDAWSTQPAIVIRECDSDTSGKAAPINPDNIKYPSEEYDSNSYPKNARWPRSQSSKPYNRSMYYAGKYSGSPAKETDRSNEIYEEPVIVTETGRLKRNDYKEAEPTLTRMLDTRIAPNIVPSQNIVNPLLHKGAVGHVDEESLQSLTEPSKLNSNAEGIALSELLRRVRQRNRIQLCREFVQMQGGPQVDTVEGSCGKNTPRCPPPAPKCPPPPKPPCPPTKPPCPKPCKPKCPPCPPPCPPPKPKCPPPCPAPCPPPKPKCPPCPAPCPPPKPKCPPPCPSPCPPPKPTCPPLKKSPCEKFTSKRSYVEIQDALTLLLYLGPQLDIPARAWRGGLNIPSERSTASSRLDFLDLTVNFDSLYGIILLAGMSAAESEGVVARGAVYTRSYEPWSPIPSWPITKKPEENKLVCPKDGCKIPKLTAPCRDINPCCNLPKPNSVPKRSFSMTGFLRSFLGEASWSI